MTDHIRKLWPILAAACVIAAALALRDGDDALKRHRREGFIRAGYSNEVPFSFVGSDGEVTGEAPEIAKAIAARLGIGEVRWHRTTFDSLIPELEAGHFDVIAGGMYIRPERAERVDFSLPTYRTQQAMVVKKGNPLRLHSFQDVVAHKSATAAAITDAVDWHLMRKLGLPEDRLVSAPDTEASFAAVKTGMADAALLTRPAVAWLLRHEAGDVEAAKPFTQSPEDVFPPGMGAFAFRKGDRKLLEAWNAELRAFIGSPEHLKLVERFGFGRDTMPPAAPKAGR